MNKQQMLWAKGHDWFVDASYRKGPDCWIVIARDYVPNDDTGEYEMVHVRFGMYEMLRDWAGY